MLTRIPMDQVQSVCVEAQLVVHCCPPKGTFIQCMHQFVGVDERVAIEVSVRFPLVLSESEKRNLDMNHLMPAPAAGSTAR